MEPPKVGKGSGKPSVKSIDAGTSGKPGPEPPKLPSNGERSALGGAGASGSSGVGACRYWGTNEGCKRGEKCKFAHAHLNPKENRCFGCSALGHSKKDCPYGKKKVARVRTADSSGKGGVEPPNGGGTDDKGENREIPPKPPGLKEVNVEKPGASAPSGGEPLDSLMQEATALMKSLRPKIKTISLRRATTGELVTGLLDGGATNPLRQGSKEELEKCVEVSVELATGTVKL